MAAIPLEKLTCTILVPHRANNSYTSLCTLGVARIEKGELRSCDVYPIKPKTKTFSFSDYHHITYETVKDAPALPDFWPSVLPLIEGQNVLIYWEEKTLKTLQESLAVYDLSFPMCNLVDLRDLCDYESLGRSYEGMAAQVEFDDFSYGSTADTLKLFRLVLEFLCNKGSKHLSRRMNIKLDKPSRKRKKKSVDEPPKNPAPTSPQSSEPPPSDIQPITTAAPGTGCLIYVITTILAVVAIIL